MKFTITILLILLLCVVLLASCRAKKIERTEIRQSDTLIVKRETIRAPNLNHTLTVHDICDSITGEVVKFRDVFVIDGDSIEILTNENNQLIRRIKAHERIISEKDSIISVREESVVNVSETVRYRIDWKWTLGALVLGLGIGLIKPWKYII